MSTQKSRFTCLIALLITLTFAGSAQASSLQRAQVGYYNGDGKIVLIEDVFLDRTLSQHPVSELSVVEEGDFLFVARKISDDAQGCLQERLQLVDVEATPLSVGSDPLNGKPVFIHSISPTRLIRCIDTNCKLLRQLVLPDDVKIEDAECDISQQSDNRCACHIDRGMGVELVRKPGLCKVNFGLSATELYDWVEPEAVETIE